MSAEVKAAVSEHASAFAGFPGILATIEHFIETNKPQAIVLIQDVLLLIDPSSKLAIALKAILAVLQAAG